ncbi:hypothetical protein JF66_08290 [Cryobacterium sp. MLB-32]|nr:hypothetical protein JF66_08290 [Cryobacterium sp. MLB-32]
MFNSASSVGTLLGSIMIGFGIPLGLLALVGGDTFALARNAILGAVAITLVISGAGLLALRRRITMFLRHLSLIWLTLLTLVCIWATSQEPLSHTFAATMAAIMLIAFAIIPSRRVIWYPSVLIPAALISLALQPGMNPETVAMDALLALGTGAAITWFVRSAITAETDWLTGVRNFAGFERATTVLLRDSKPGEPVSLCRIDLDGFSLVNQRRGYDAGDDALIAFTSELQSLLPPTVVLGRIEGDAFALLFPGQTSGQAQDLLEAVHPSVMSFTTGIAMHDADESASELFGRAGIALYDAKRAGFGRTSIHGGYYASVSAVQQGIAQGEFYILYQPCVDLRSGRAVGAEASCAGTTPLAARSPRSSSSLSARPAGPSRPWANGCSSKPSQRRRSGTTPNPRDSSRSAWPSTHPRVS